MNFDLLTFVISLVCFIPAVICHEVAHGWVANKLGDPTAKALGRLTLNPLKHIDPFGSLLLPAFLAIVGAPVFGYAKPVPYNPQNFGAGAKTREEYVKKLKRGELLVGLSGPATNIILALLGAALFQAGKFIGIISPSVGAAILLVAQFFVLINLILAFFNLIPLPPLDGSSIIAVFLPPKALQYYYKVQQYGMFILLAVLFLLPVIGIDPLGWYFDHTAYALANLLLF